MFGAYRVGDTLDATTDMGSMVARGEAEHVEAWIAEAGAERNGNVTYPTVLAGFAAQPASNATRCPARR